MTDEEILGKAYDARLMRRLLVYLHPHRQAATVALVAIVGHSLMQLAPPYLTKLAIDRHILTGDLSGLDQVACCFSCSSSGRSSSNTSRRTRCR